MRVATPNLMARRQLGGSTLAAVGAAALGVIPRRAAASGPTPTPRQTAGPFYPTEWSGDVDGDLVVLRGAAAAAQGVVMHLRGRVLRQDGAPVPGAVVEIWQCDAFGRYRHPRDSQTGRDPGFQGFGRVTAGTDGAFAFRTIRPVSYPGRAPHIHAGLATSAGRPVLTTQFYLADDPLNARDMLFAGLRSAAQRDAVLMRPAAADGIEPGALLAVRDVVIA